ncbi:MAG: amidohydrolase [Gammaproteobacteria bacterium]|nr:amidohydrolase [Gammaproteobacteria bacterium]
MHGHRIDVHHHFLPPEYVAEVGGERIASLILAGKVPDWSAQASLEAMDRNGIQSAITSISAPGLWFGDPAQTRRLCRHCNDFAGTLRDAHPGRFGVFASLPLPDVPASLAEIDHALDEIGADGIGLLTRYGDRYPGDPAFAAVFDALDARAAVVYFHPTDAPCGDCQPEIPAATLDFPFDTTRAVVSLLFSGTFTRCPNIRFIFSHAGGTIPFLAERIARLAALPRFAASVPDGVRPVLEGLFYDTALSANPLSFASLLALVSHRQVLFGSDYPFAPESTMTASIEGLAGLGLEAAVLRGIERDHALSLFPRLRVHGG